MRCVVGGEKALICKLQCLQSYRRRVEKREFASDFSQLSCPYQKRTRVTCH